MMSMAVSELTVIGQVGTTIGLGLLFDTLVVRSFMTPSIAALLGPVVLVAAASAAAAVAAPWPKPSQQSAVSGARRRPVMKRTVVGIGVGDSGIGVRRARACRPRHRLHQRAAHVRHLRPEGLQRLDRQDHVQAAGQGPRRRCVQVGAVRLTCSWTRTPPPSRRTSSSARRCARYCPDKMPILEQAAR